MNNTCAIVLSLNPFACKLCISYTLLILIKGRKYIFACLPLSLHILPELYALLEGLCPVTALSK